LLDEVFVSSTEHVRRDALVRKIVFVKMLDQGVDDLVRDKRLPAAIGRGLIPIDRENATQFFVALATARIAVVKTSPDMVEARLHLPA